MPTIPDYELLRRIGGGAYGEVWLARNVLGELRAVKVIYRGRFTDPRPFEREFEGIRRFEPISRSHPSQLAILHVGKNDDAGCFYYVMELADNANACKDAAEETSNDLPASYTARTLRFDIEQQGRFPISDCVRIGLSLTTALAHLHAQNLVHRDIKPSNVIFVKGVPKLGDIGLVTEAGDTQSIVGTEGYIPTEGPGTVQADIFSLGKVLYEISTGMDRRRFPELPQDLHCWADWRAVIELNEVVLRACAKDPARRYPSAIAMQSDLETLQEGRSVRRCRQRERQWRWTRNAVLGLIGATVVIAVWSRFRQAGFTGRHEIRSTNEVANGFYDLGRFYFDKTTGSDFRTAASYFEQATNADPRFAQAYASLALTYMWTMEGWGDNANKFLPQARETALQALDLNKSLPEPYVALAWYNIMINWDWRDAEQQLQRAVALDPSRGIFHHFYAEFLRMSGRTKEALAQMEQARKLERLSVSINLRWVDHLVGARQYERAIEAADHFIAMEPNIPSAPQVFKIRALCALGRYEEAIEARRKRLELQWRSPEKAAEAARQLREAYAKDGANGYWRVELEFAQAAHETPFWLARAYAQLGDKDNTFKCLQEDVERRDLWLTFYVMTDPTLDPVRSDRRFQEILKAMHLK